MQQGGPGQIPGSGGRAGLGEAGQGGVGAEGLAQPGFHDAQLGLVGQRGLVVGDVGQHPDRGGVAEGGNGRGPG